MTKKKMTKQDREIEKLQQWKRTVENAFTALTAHGFITSLRVAMRQAEYEFMGRLLGDDGLRDEARKDERNMLRAVPITLAQANEFVKVFHRHHAPVVGHRWSVAIADEDKLRGVAICGRPVARALPHQTLLEINRLATDGTPNACSKLYGMCAAIAKLMGFSDIETSILCTEPGTSLKAAGFLFRRTIKGRDWNCPSRGGRRTDQPMCDKQVWGKKL